MSLVRVPLTTYLWMSLSHMIILVWLNRLAWFAGYCVNPEVLPSSLGFPPFSKKKKTSFISCSLNCKQIQGLVRAVTRRINHARTTKLISAVPIPIFPKNNYNKFLKDEKLAKTHTIPDKGLSNVTVSDVLMTKGDEKVGSWLSCRTDETVYDAAKRMAQNNIGSLVVLKPGEQQLIAGIFTERDYLRKVIGQDRSSKLTKVGEIMTDQEKLITVASDTNILQAMQLMTENHIRHAPVIDGKIVGMISIVDVVRAVLDQQHGEFTRINEFIHGKYY